MSDGSQACSRNEGKLAFKPMMGHRKKYVSKSVIRSKSETFGCSEHNGVLVRRVSVRRKKLGVWLSPKQCNAPTRLVGRQEDLSFLAEAEMKAVDPDQCLDMDDSDADDFQVFPDRDAAVLSGPRVRLEDDPMSLSAKPPKDPRLNDGWR